MINTPFFIIKFEFFHSQEFKQPHLQRLAIPTAMSVSTHDANTDATPEGGCDDTTEPTMEPSTWLDDFLKLWVCFKIVSVSTITYVNYQNMLTMYITFEGESDEYGYDRGTYIVEVEFSKVFELFKYDYKKVKQIRIKLENLSEENEAVIGTIRKFFKLYYKYYSSKQELPHAYKNDTEYECMGRESSQSDDILDRIRTMFHGIHGYSKDKEDELMQYI